MLTLTLLVLAGCATPNDPIDTSAVDACAGAPDLDGDGFSVCAGDCDDSNARLFPYDRDGTLDACGWQDINLGWAHSRRHPGLLGDHRGRL